MERFSTIALLRGFIRDRKLREETVAFVPTMGALHDGHRSCMEIARELGDLLVVSIFVNPTQFGPGEDLDAYPVTLQDDVRLCAEWGCDVVFVPDTTEMYPTAQRAWVDVDNISAPLCGKTRRGHFRGVATVVAKLFHIVGPDVAVFGQKDAQQALVIKEMAAQLNLPVAIHLSPIIREADGLAWSSRNRYLSPEERQRAPGIHQALEAGHETVVRGERDPGTVCRTVTQHLESCGITDIEYVELLNAEDLTAVDRATGKVIVAVAARIGSTRLIDNVVLRVGAGEDVEETLLF
jgi:pantoate--beta-alanine ligase